MTRGGIRMKNSMDPNGCLRQRRADVDRVVF